jgi:AcrR family transcriptional regulator
VRESHEDALTQAAIPNLKERKQVAVREGIWEVATDLFVRNGYDETTVDDIALAAGVSPRSFFRYFASKGDLMAYAMRMYADQIVEVIEGCPKTFSISEIFQQALFQLSGRAVEYHARTRKILAIIKRSPEADAAAMSRVNEAQALVATAFEKRLPKEPQYALAAAVMAGVTLHVTGNTVRWCFEHSETDIAAAVQRVLATLQSIFGSGLPVAPPKSRRSPRQRRVS